MERKFYVVLQKHLILMSIYNKGLLLHLFEYSLYVLYTTVYQKLELKFEIYRAYIPCAFKSPQINYTVQQIFTWMYIQYIRRTYWYTKGISGTRNSAKKDSEACLKFYDRVYIWFEDISTNVITFLMHISDINDIGTLCVILWNLWGLCTYLP